MNPWGVSRRIGDVCEVVAGQSPDGTTYNDTFQGIEFHQGKKLFDGDALGRSSVFTSNPSKVAIPGDVLMSVRAPVGPVVLLDREVCIGRGLAAIRSGVGLNPRFLLRFLQSVEQSISGKDGAVFPSITRAEIEKLEIPVPPLDEQQRIVTKLDEILNITERADSNIATAVVEAKLLSSNLLNELLVEMTGQSPFAPLGDVAERVVVGFVGTCAPFYCDDGVPFLRTQNVTSSGLNLESYKRVTSEFHQLNKKSQLQSGDVLLSRVITNAVNVGVVPDGIGPANCANVVVVRPGDRLVPEFLAAYVQSSLGQRYLLSRKVGSAQVVVNTSVVKAWPVPVPSVDDQRHLVGLTSVMSQRINELVAKLQQRKQEVFEFHGALLRAAFNGEL